jgi:uncharacterized protein YkwD
MMRAIPYRVLALLVVTGLAGCSSEIPVRNTDRSSGGSSGGRDTGVADTGATDSGATDSGATDTGTADTGTADTGTADTGVVDSWPASWTRLEADVLAGVNAARARGANCDSEGVFGPAPALSLNPILVGTARAMSKDMGARNFFDHTDPDGLDPFQRMEAAGYNGGAMGENIAAGYATGAEVVAGWLTSDGHCRNIMDPDFGVIGIGYASVPGSDYTHYWTQNFGDR